MDEARKGHGAAVGEHRKGDHQALGYESARKTGRTGGGRRVSRRPDDSLRSRAHGTGPKVALEPEREAKRSTVGDEMNMQTKGKGHDKAEPIPSSADVAIPRSDSPAPSGV